MAFLQDTDYSVLIRNEIKSLLEEENPADRLKAESMAIAQMKAYLSGRYDVDAIFIDPGTPDTRNMHIVMLAIDITLYHLYSSEAPGRMPEHRSNRYEDALSWLKDAARGNIKPDLPLLTNDEGEESLDIRFNSRLPNNHKW